MSGGTRFITCSGPANCAASRSASCAGSPNSSGDDGISWDKTNNCYVGTVSLGYDSQGRRRRRTVRGRTKTEVKDKLKALHEEINAGVHTPATYTIRECVSEWLDELIFDPHTMATYRGQAEKWIYPAIGGEKLKDFKVADAERFFRELATVLSKRSLMMVKSTLRRSIRRAQKHDLIGKNVAELVDLPEGQPGRPSRAMTEEQAGKVLVAARGTGNAYVKVIRIGEARTAATHAATEDGQVACGNKPRKNAEPADVSADLGDTTCRACRAQLDIDADANPRLEALFVLSITLGLRPGELRALTWDHVDLDQGVIHVWRSTRRDGDTKTPKSRRSLVLPRRAIDALQAHRKRQAAERFAAGEAWHDTNLVFCYEDGRQYSSDALNWRFSKMTRRAGIGHWHAHEGRHTAVSIMSTNGVPIQEISDTVGHKSTHVTETVYRHVIVPAIRGGASVMDSVFGDRDADEHADTAGSQ
jgi:integrase